ncbi:MAG: MFS transporter [Candidatus Saccharimonadales bacterium]
MTNIKLSLTTRRLLPLYISSFLQGIPFWYAIEKLFMTSIGFNTASIGLMVAIMSIVMLVVETPSGVLADRWSRKGVMLLGCGSLLLAGIVGGFSYNEAAYILSTVFWGIYAALYSGTYDSVIYDVNLEEHGDSSRYEYYLGRLRAVEGLAFVLGALGGGLIANYIGMRATFFLSLPFLLLGGIILLSFKEPKLHKMEVSEPVFRHIRQTFAAVLRNRQLLPVVVSTVGFAVLMDTIFELSQLWFIAVAAPLALYGIFSATLFSTWTIGGMIAARLRGPIMSIVGLIIIFASLLGLIFVRNYWLILLSQFLLGAGLVGYGVILSKKLHDELPSKLRAGSSSVISTLGRTILIPGSLVFTYVANQQTIFTASYLLLAVAAIAIVGYLFTQPWRYAKQPLANQ